MITIYKIKSLDTTIVISDNKLNINCQSTIKLTNKAKLDIKSRVERVENEFFKIASIARKKEKKNNFFNKHKK